MKRLRFLTVLLILPIIVIAQARKNIYAELGGPGGMLSANYDTRLSEDTNGFGMRIGVGTLFDAYTNGLTIPVGIRYLVGKRKSFLELGTGVSYISFPRANQDSWFNFREEKFLLPYGWVGYRYQPLQKGFTFRAGLCQYFKDLRLPVIFGVPSLYPSFSFGFAF